MTVSSSTSFVSYAGNGSLTTFAYTFKIFQDSDLLVTLVNDASGVETTKVLTTDYTVTGAGSAGGGNVVLTTAPASGTTVKIRRVLPVTQETDYVANDPFPAEAHEDALDKLTMLVQQEAANSDLAIQFPEGDIGSGLNNIVPAAVDRADRLLAFDTEGNVETKSAADLFLNDVIGANYTKASHTGNGSITAFSTSVDPGSKNNIQVYIDGVYQNKDTFSISGSVLTFSEAPPLNSAIEFIVGNAVTSITGDASAITYNQGGTGAQDRTLTSRLQDFVSVKDFGAVGDGVTDDTTAFTNACSASTNVVIPAGMNLLISKTTLSTSYLHIVMEGDAKITISNSDLTGHGLTLTGSFMKITGGTITCSGAGYFAGFLVQVESYNCQLDTVTINYVNKASYTGDGVNIPYNTGVVRFAQPFCILKNCNVYYGEGTGITVTRENCEITSCRISNNITGIIVEYGGSSGYGDNCRITDNLIYDNNASTTSLSGEDGILTYDTKGHIIADNQIWGSGEHGTYIQSTDNTITGNVIFENYSSGLKLGGGFRSTVTGNNCYDNNTSNTTDAAEIYIQSPYGNSTISSNTCSNNTGTGVRGIRVVWLSGNAVVGQESRMIIDGNSLTGTFSAAGIQANGYGEIVISNNTVQGLIALGQSSAGDPVVANSVLSGNRATQLSVTKCSDPLIEGNHTENLSLSANVDNAIMRENILTAQSSRILFQTWDEFSDNIVTYTETTPSNSMFEQSGSVSDNSNKRILNNRFESSGGRMISFTTSGISGNFLMVMNNEFNGSGYAVYTWGDNHQIIANRSTDGSNIAYIRGTNSIIKNNMANIAIEFPASNTVGDNVTPI